MENEIQNQVNKKQIKNEQECRGGSSVLSDPSVSELVDALYPNIGRNGLVRECSKENPGKGSNENNWADVGTCGTNDKGQELGRCWLSKQSYKDALSEYDLERRQGAEDFFKDLNINDNVKEIKEEITKLKSERTNIDKKSDSAEEDYLDIVDSFKDLDSQTINFDLSGEINFEIAETYYEIALFLNKKEIEEKPSESVTYKEFISPFEEEKGCCTIPVSNGYECRTDKLKCEYTLYTEVIGSDVPQPVTKTAKWISDGFCDQNNQCIPIDSTQPQEQLSDEKGCEIRYDDLSIFLLRAHPLIFKYFDSKWYWKVDSNFVSNLFNKNLKEHSNYNLIEEKHVQLLATDTYKDIFGNFLGETGSDYEEGVSILLSYAKQKEDTLIVYKEGKKYKEYEFKDVNYNQLGVLQEISKICDFEIEIEERIKYNENDEAFIETENGFDILFDHNSAEVKSVDDANYYISNYLGRLGKIEISVIGYASEDGTEEYNLELSRRRAESVAKIIRNYGRSVSVIAKGETTQFGEGEENYSLNRKVEVIFEEVQ